MERGLDTLEEEESTDKSENRRTSLISLMKTQTGHNPYKPN